MKTQTQECRVLLHKYCRVLSSNFIKLTYLIFLTKRCTSQKLVLCSISALVLCIPVFVLSAFFSFLRKNAVLYKNPRSCGGPSLEPLIPKPSGPSKKCKKPLGGTAIASLG